MIQTHTYEFLQTLRSRKLVQTYAVISRAGIVQGSGGEARTNRSQFRADLNERS
ncbi:UNVERIFIED_CONTAM: hypothetical protein K2H54_054980, partial [Gekko kuhli]